MELIKENKEKSRKVFFNGTNYVKVWDNATPKWISEHVAVLKKIMPGYVVDHGVNWISFSPIEGIPASQMEHTDKFIKDVYEFCLNQIQQTNPYAHGDWVLSNIIVDGDNMTMVDWDNVGIYTKAEILTKLHSDLKSAFGDKFNYDPSSI